MEEYYKFNDEPKEFLQWKEKTLLKPDLSNINKFSSELSEEEILAFNNKGREIIKKIKRLLANEPNRKIILFSEYVDTIHHLEKRFKSEFKNEVLVCDGKVSKDLARHLNSDFNAQYNRG